METPSESPRAKLVHGTACSFTAAVLVRLAFIFNSKFVARLFGTSELGIPESPYRQYGRRRHEGIPGYHAIWNHCQGGTRSYG